MSSFWGKVAGEDHFCVNDHKHPSLRSAKQCNEDSAVICLSKHKHPNSKSAETCNRDARIKKNKKRNPHNCMKGTCDGHPTSEQSFLCDMNYMGVKPTLKIWCYGRPPGDILKALPSCPSDEEISDEESEDDSNRTEDQSD